MDLINPGKIVFCSRRQVIGVNDCKSKLVWVTDHREGVQRNIMVKEDKAEIKAYHTQMTSRQNKYWAHVRQKK